MKILIWEPNDGALHGNQNFLLLLAAAANEDPHSANHEFIFSVPNRSELYWALKEQGAWVLVPPKKGFIKTAVWLSRQARIQGVHALLCMNEKSIISMVFSGLFSKKPLFWYIKNMRRSLFLDITLGLASSKILIISNEILNRKGTIFRRAFASKTKILPLGIPINKFRNLERPSKSFRQFEISMLSSISPFKGVNEAIESVKQLFERGIDIHLTLAGAVPGGQEAYAEKIRQQAQQYPFFSWVGWVKDNETLISKANLVILPSYSEGVPRSLVEAMASGRPVVATDVGGIKSLVKHRKNGLLVSAGNTEQLTESVLYLIENGDLRIKMGENAANFVAKHHDFEAHFKKLCHLLSEHQHNSGL